MLNLNLSAFSFPAYNETKLALVYENNINTQGFNIIKADPSPPEPVTGHLIMYGPRCTIDQMVKQ